MLQYFYIISASPVKSTVYIHFLTIDLYFFLCSLLRKTLLFVAVDFVFRFSLVSLYKIEVFWATSLVVQWLGLH